MLIRLVMLFAIVFGVAYGLTVVARSARQKKLLKKINEANAKVRALDEAHAAGELDDDEHRSLVRVVYTDAKSEGVEIEIPSEENEWHQD